MVAAGGCRGRVRKEERVLWVSIGSSGGGLEAGRHEGTRGASRRGLVGQKRG